PNHRDGRSDQREPRQPLAEKHNAERDGEQWRRRRQHALATATPAYLTDAPYSNELTAVTTASTISRSNGGQPPRMSTGTPRIAHGVTHRISAPTGRRIACALTGSISSSGTRSATTDTPHASAARSGSTTPRQGRGWPGASVRASTISTSPASVRRPPTM